MNDSSKSATYYSVQCVYIVLAFCVRKICHISLVFSRNFGSSVDMVSPRSLLIVVLLHLSYPYILASAAAAPVAVSHLCIKFPLKGELQPTSRLRTSRSNSNINLDMNMVLCLCYNTALLWVELSYAQCFKGSRSRI